MCRAVFAIDIDEPFEIGGGNAYANPQEYLLAAMNACMIARLYRTLRIAGHHIGEAGDHHRRGYRPARVLWARSGGSRRLS